MTTRHRRAVPASVTLDDRVGRQEQNWVVWSPIFLAVLERSQRRTPEFRRAVTGWRLDRRLAERRRATT